MSNAKAISLDDMIAENRRARASEIASATMGRLRSQGSNVPTGPAKLNGRGSIGKRAAASGSGIGNLAPATGLNGKWTHDLHQHNNASRVSKLPTTLSPAIARSLQGNRLFAALHGAQTPTGPSADVIPSGPRKNRGANIRGQASGFSIKGFAGPFVVQASNFAPGTTAEDIKMAMLPLGKILSCIILSANPTVICEIVFEKKEAADQCILQYNNQLADGRLLHLTLKPGPPVSRLMHHGGAAPRPPPRQTDPNVAREEADRQRRLTNISYQDGSYGVRPPPLYSDALVQRGRGFNSSR
ncbi:uncharacterized protein H6S33_000736 [Morchella sextelata]|uniref:uncharacterized protein n=1 Tax=Morchella sextelata TaxID=1174677 RepID=UPI001D04C3A2|nr:uncharacterized protein H6S33_000736 [Morchella sextelata]KAH0615100.1 hypothetical protein H6S33_000736 [Morchella sextelata]